MKKLFLLIALSAATLCAGAQARFGYFSYEAVLESMPECATVKHDLDQLRQKYDAELRRAETEFNAKYEEFLDGQRDFAPAILRKRQAELQEIVEKNAAFRKESERLLQQAGDDAYRPLRRRLDAAVAKVGQARAYEFVINTDSNACPYISPAVGEDATPYIKSQLGLH